MNKWLEKLFIFGLGAVFTSGGFYAATSLNIGNNKLAIASNSEKIEQVTPIVNQLSNDMDWVKSRLQEQNADIKEILRRLPR